MTISLRLSTAPLFGRLAGCFLVWLLTLTTGTALAQTNTWTGTASTNWNTAANWSQATVPLATDDVMIGPGPARQPAIGSGTPAVAKSVEVQTGASLNIANGGSLTINGSKSVDGNTTAFYNMGTVSNSGQLIIGNTATAGAYGLRNRATFSNNTGGTISIDRTTLVGLYNNDGSFTNAATLTIGAVAAVGSHGLYNQATFSNNTGGTISIDRVSSVGLTNIVGNFTNAATITIGALAAVGSIGVDNQARFNNTGCGGLIRIVADAIIDNRGNFTNGGTIIENATSDYSNITTNTGLVQNLNGGTFTIYINMGILTTSPGIIWTGCTSANWNTATNWSGGSAPTATDDVVIAPGAANQPAIGNGTLAVAKSVEVQSGASLSITSGGSLTLNGSKYMGGFVAAFYNNGMVQSSGQLVIGNLATAEVGQLGLYNQATFQNNAGGAIRIDRTDTFGLLNKTGSSFTNSATITIGAVASGGSIGIDNQATFQNNAGGIIRIDRTDTFGLLNDTGSSFTNSATITIGAVAAVGRYGLYNQAIFTNNAGASISIDQTSIIGLVNQSGSFTNSATIVIGTVAAVGNYGIDNRATFTNQGCGGLIRVVSDNIIYNNNTGTFANGGTIIENATGDSNISSNTGLVQNLNGGTFAITTNTGVLTTSPGIIWTGCISANWNTATNWSGGSVPTATDDVVIAPGAARQPAIGRGTLAVANSVEVQGGASLSIASGATLTINGSKTVGRDITAFYNNGTVQNSGQLVIGNTASAGDYGIYNRATFSNNAGGTIQIDRTTTTGLFNFSGSFANSATITIGAVASVGVYGLHNAATFSNNAGATIRIDRTSSYGLGNSSGSFINLATITIGAVAAVGRYGLYNQAIFTNNAGASISIDRTANYGLENNSGSFTNAATITIGAVAALGNYGIINKATFNNNTGGAISIDRTSNYGLENSSGSFTNAGAITIGAVSAVGNYGIRNDATFNNNAGGNIRIDRATEYGLLNDSGSFANAATITIGAVSAVGRYGIRNNDSFQNNGCGGLIRIVSDNIINNTGTFANGGILIENASGNSNISTNTGVVQNGNGGTFFIATNTGIVVGSLTGCAGTPINPALQIGTGSTLTVGSTWYADATLTQPAGTYSQNTNTFTATNLAPGSGTLLYFAITDNTGCSRAVSVSVTINQSTITAVIDPVSATLTCASPTVSLTASGGSVYAWDDNSTNAVRTVSAQGTYSVTVSNGVGCPAVASVSVSQDNSVPTASLVSSGPLTCAVTSMTLTASPGGLSYVFSAGATQIGSTNQATVNAPGLYLVTVSSGNGCVAVAAATVLSNTATVSITNPVTSTATQGIAFSQPFSASPTGGYSFSLASGSLPPGLNLATIGVVSGTPTQTGSFPFTVRATDVNGCSGVSSPYALTVSPPTGPATLTITSFNCFSTNGALTSVNFVIGYSDGTFTPAKPDLFINGITITGQLGVQYGLAFDANQSELPIADQASRQVYFVWNYRAACTSIPIKPPAPMAPVASALPNQSATQGTPFSYVVPAFTGTAPITYSASNLPAGLTFDANSRTIAGTPTTVQTPTVTISASNVAGMSSGQFTIAVSASAVQPPTPTGPATLTITSFNCFSTNGALSSVNFVVGYANGTFTPPLPDLFINGITITGQLGVQYSLSFDANQSELPIADQATRQLYFVWNYRQACTGGGVTPPIPPPPVAPVAPALPSLTATVGTPFSYVVPPFAGTAPIVYSASGLPNGLSFDASSRMISGTPTTVQIPTVTISASNAAGMSSGQFTIAVSASVVQPPTPTGPATLTVTSFTCITTNSVLTGVNFKVTYSDGAIAPAVPDLFINGITITGQLGIQYSLSFDANQNTIVVADLASRSVYFTWNFRQACATRPNAQRLSSEAVPAWQVSVLGNPVGGTGVDLSVRHAQGRSLLVRVSDIVGHLVSEQTIPVAEEVQTLRAGLSTQGGVYVIQVSDGLRQQSLRVVRP